MLSEQWNRGGHWVADGGPARQRYWQQDRALGHVAQHQHTLIHQEILSQPVQQQLGIKRGWRKKKWYGESYFLLSRSEYDSGSDFEMLQYLMLHTCLPSAQQGIQDKQFQFANIPFSWTQKTCEFVFKRLIWYYC